MLAQRARWYALRVLRHLAVVTLRPPHGRTCMTARPGSAHPAQCVPSATAVYRAHCTTPVVAAIRRIPPPHGAGHTVCAKRGSCLRDHSPPIVHRAWLLSLARDGSGAASPHGCVRPWPSRHAHIHRVAAGRLQHPRGPEPASRRSPDGWNAPDCCSLCRSLARCLRQRSRMRDAGPVSPRRA
jgi:hypothetical protein